ncbi:MAG: alpha/beta fold hydrolase [Brasilonema octagenarum HA4186-MV1]|jgi:pimeloyl-ACP methyl ester carboxylesterase|uniref:Alpha/beta hydrolase n=1 Tax=Brasilonema octagenarum UFV-OR1 TaxID=417115 RepID=A0ABX1M616_9CYAN|nr:alpha/beta hydrolase [Brasilonema octagenarum]MBW4624531.1 alpha/beta fold hydrolase [Brasilonema octagenarum HA4186-MV1]NMF63983.1 alpha/beta hydrolase [Brasilonema octagenarum UFV-OR1]
MSTFVLVHGAWHEGSAWNEVIKQLEAKGHQAFAPTIAGHGKGVNKNVNHAQCTQSIVDYIVSKDLTDIVLLGHSFGGTIIAKVAEAVSDRIKRLIFFNAFVLNDGDRLTDNIPPDSQALFDKLARESDDNTMMLPSEVWREAFINDADLDLARSSYAQLSPEPYQPFLDKLDLKQFYSLPIPKSYLYCTEDNVLPQGEQWGWHPRMSNRLGLFRLVQMPGSHEVMFSNPIGLAEKIIVAGRD